MPSVLILLLASLVSSASPRPAHASKTPMNSTSHDKAVPPAESAGDLALDSLNLDDDAPAQAAPAKPQPAPAPPEPKASQLEGAPPIVAQLEAATKGLQMPSETDAPFRVVYWPLEQIKLSESEVALYAAEKPDAPVETQSVEAFFKNAVKVEDWMKDDEKANAARFAKLVETLQNGLENPRVYLIGKTERTVAIIGKAKGGFAGLITLVVET